MATTETWVLDSVPLTSGNFQILELTADPPKARPDWVTAADSEGSALMRQPMHENRTITMKLRIMPQASMDVALDQVGVLQDKCRSASATPDGVALVWTPANSTRSRTFDVIAGEITEIPIGLEGQAISWFKQRPIVTVELTCKPYWRGAEVLTSTAAATTPVLSIEVANVPGDIPALGRLLVTDSATQHRRDIEWGIENQFYTSGAPSTLILDSDGLTVTGYAGLQTTRTGAYDPNASGNNVIRADTQRHPMAVCGTGVQSHVGMFRVHARIWASDEAFRVRLSWQDGDGPLLSNEWATPSVVNGFCDVDLGTIVVSKVTQGTQRWSGRIDAMISPSQFVIATGTIDIDFLALVPVGEGYGRARATNQLEPGVVTIRDEFTGTTAGGVLNSRSAPVGGTWATSGATTDFVFEDAPGELCRRATASDTGTGRYAILGSTAFTNVEVRIGVIYGVSSQAYSSVIARYTNTSNFLFAKWRMAADAGGSLAQELILGQVVAGVTTELRKKVVMADGNTWYNIRLLAYTSGRCFAYIQANSGAILHVVEAQSSAVATGGALATGTTGFSDYNPLLLTGYRYYDEFAAGPPAPEPIALYSGRAMEFRHDSTVRQDSTGTYYGRVPSYRGSRFVVPTGTSRVVVKPHRNDLVQSEYAPLGDNTTLQVGWTQRGIAVPR